MNIFDTTPFLPLGHHEQFPDWLATVFLVSNSLIAVTYFGIAAMLTVGLVKASKSETAFLTKASKTVTLMFIFFITGCAITRVLRVLMMYTPMYYLLGAVEIITTLFSVITLLMLIFVTPRMTFFQLALKSEVDSLLKQSVNRLKNLNDGDVDREAIRNV